MTPLDPATPLGAQFQESIAADATIQALALPPAADVSKAAGNLRKLLATAQFAPIETEYANLKGPKKWHRLFGGPNDLRSPRPSCGQGGPVRLSLSVLV